MADLFGSLANPTTPPPSRWWSSVPFSVLAHGLVLALAVIVPLAATGAIPTPSSVMVFAAVPPPRPVPDVPAPPPTAASSVVPVNAVPLDAPTTIAPEPETSPAPSAVFTAPGGVPMGGGGEGVSLAPPLPPPPPAPPAEPVRLTSAMRVPSKTVDVAPVYPPIARAAKVSGVVILEAVIGVDGRVEDARVLRSIPMLDQAALAAVRQWRYTPTMLNGVAVPIVLTVTVIFTLK